MQQGFRLISTFFAILNFYLMDIERFMAQFNVK